MAQTTLITPGTTENTSDDIVVPAGAVACIGEHGLTVVNHE